MHAYRRIIQKFLFRKYHNIERDHAPRLKNEKGSVAVQMQPEASRLSSIFYARCRVQKKEVDVAMICTCEISVTE